MIDKNQEEDFRRERAYLQAEKELKEKQLMQQIFEEEMTAKPAKIVLGRPRKAGKFGQYATVSLRKFFRKPDRHKRKDVH
jgi:hypothetical protein